jgi:hypothetical protein
MPTPNQLAKLNFPGVDDVFQQWLHQLTDTVNTLAGHQGDIQLASPLDLGGNRIKNIGAPQGSGDALQNGTAASTYSAAALKSSFEAGGPYAFSGYRQINNQDQREQVSSYMNNLMSSVPNANNLYPTLTNSGGSVSVSVPAGQFFFSDGSSVNTTSRVDLLSKPTQYAISSISCSAGVVTVNCVASGLVAGSVATITGVTPSAFNGTFTLSSSTGGGAVLTYQDDLGTVSGSGGYVAVNGVYYYALRKKSTTLALLGPFSGDTLQNRIQANYDGFQIVCVVTITNSGGQVAQSGGGGSPIVGSPTAGSFF